LPNEHPLVEYVTDQPFPCAHKNIFPFASPQLQSILTCQKELYRFHCNLKIQNAYVQLDHSMQLLQPFLMHPYSTIHFIAQYLLIVFSIFNSPGDTSATVASSSSFPAYSFSAGRTRDMELLLFLLFHYLSFTPIYFIENLQESKN
jgi:hypothetical protein